MSETKTKVVFSGIRPTGSAHLGNYIGALSNWVRLQDLYRCIYCIVDWHALSSEYENPRAIRDNTFEMACDLLGVGLDPDKCTLFVQSAVKEHAELHLLLSMITPLGWLERVPTFKGQQQEIADRDLNTYGFLGYPLLQTADIVVHRAEFVPVGEDQAYHLEIAREIVRRFNRMYGPVFPEPQILLTEVPLLSGVDGRKMSKSYGNAIYLKDSPEVIRKKIAPMVTDTRRKRRSDPGEPNDCPVFSLHKAFVDKDRREALAAGCRTASVGCLECKAVVIDSLIGLLTPYWEKRRELEADPARVWKILDRGNEKARDSARRTMEDVRAALGF